MVRFSARLRPGPDGKGRTSEYVGKALPEGLAEEFGVPEDELTAD